MDHAGPSPSVCCLTASSCRDETGHRGGWGVRRAGAASAHVLGDIAVGGSGGMCAARAGREASATEAKPPT